MDAPAAGPVAAPRQLRRAVIALDHRQRPGVSDFILYGFFATVIADTFFPASNHFLSLMLKLATFAVGFVVRPIGGILLGLYADRFGRKRALTLPILLMAGSTVPVGAIPGYANDRPRRAAPDRAGPPRVVPGETASVTHARTPWPAGRGTVGLRPGSWGTKFRILGDATVPADRHRGRWALPESRPSAMPLRRRIGDGGVDHSPPRSHSDDLAGLTVLTGRAAFIRCAGLHIPTSAMHVPTSATAGRRQRAGGAVQAATRRRHAGDNCL